MHRDHHTLIAELLPAPMFADPSLGHPYQQYDPTTGRTTRHSVILADRQPAGIPLTWSHDAAELEPAGKERAGTLAYLERDGRGAIWGLFAVTPDLDVGDTRHLSIGFTGKALHYLDKRAPAADPTMTPDERAYLRDGQAVHAVMDHVALTATPAARTREVAIVPVDFTVGAGGLGYPHGYEEHRGIIERAARHLDAERTVHRGYGAPATVDIVDSPYGPKRRALDEDDDGDIVGWRNGVAIRAGDDVAHPAAASCAGVPMIRRSWPNQRLTIR